MINRQLKETDRKKSCAASFFCIKALPKRNHAGLSLLSSFVRRIDVEYLESKDPQYDLVAPVVEGMGYSIVELKSRIVQRQLHVALVVHREPGVSLEDCSQIFRTIQPRLEMANSSRDISLEVSSPGISRRLKSADELLVFKGRGIKYLLDEESDWHTGIIGQANADSVSILQEDHTEEISLSRIKRIKLDDTQRSGGRL